ncbi:sec-independent protein translocase protein TATB, chloroplastic [Selaginella moellendorffii]|uniref:sec-independent protein translocase protein TATB, chloroplastic n=1 Tax=Selaginella moellendorffii TaxID=88036 RepID=UPI000D1CC4A3|nr:sec-independent protein translocase protein TATB, chloroplastic [Selaginella moellendorffii]|eukprot:XP_002992704.2 sec-independent protein translocase protein TATB, chloroplastic [Selaginella moellendorffii]
MISVAMAPLAGAGAALTEQHSRNGFRLAIHSSRGRGGGARACRSKLIFPRAGLCYTSTWSSWIHQNKLDCSLLLSRARYRSSNRPYRGVVRSSLLGVGAPEVIVIAVVALLVFGPKGLAEIARSLGQSLRAFQPTIRELQEVSKEFKQTLEKEIGLDELKKPAEPPKRAPPPVNENFVVDELTAQLNLMQQEKENADAQETKPEEANPSSVVVASSSGDDTPPSPAPSEVETTPSPAPSEVLETTPVIEKEAAVNNVAKD